MLEVLRTDYIKFARARGLTNRAINFGHALKNTLVPVITIIGLQLGSLIAFAIVTETVFQWPGIGLLFIQSVQFADIPVMAAYLMLIGLLFVVINLVVDLLYFVVDPRLRGEGGGARVAGTEMATRTRPRRAGCIACPTATSGGASVLAGRRSSRRRSTLLSSSPRRSCRRWLAPHNPFDPATLSCSDALKPPVLVGRRRLGLPARHRRPGPRHPVGHHVRRAHLARRRPRLGARSPWCSASRSACSPAISAARSTR